MIDKTHHEKLMYNTFNIMKREREREKPRNMLHIVWRTNNACIMEKRKNAAWIITVSIANSNKNNNKTHPHTLTHSNTQQNEIPWKMHRRAL